MEKGNTQSRGSGGLSEKEELLLMQFCDGEGSFLVKWGARRLLRSRAAARVFIEDVRFCGDVVRQRGGCIDRVLSPSWSVAPAVQLDIERQECVRRAVVSRGPWFSLPSEVGSRLGWGATGALTAASLVLVLASPRGGTSGGLVAPSAVLVQATAPFSSAGIQPVAIKAERPLGEGAALDSQSRRLRVGVGRGNALRHGVEWYRSGGELQFIEAPGARGPLMWVMRSGSPRRRPGQPQGIPTVSFVGGAGVAQGEVGARGGQ